MPLQALSVIDLDTTQPYVVTVHAKQYDTVRTIEAHLYSVETEWLVPENNIYFVVSYKKINLSNRNTGFYDTTESGKTAVTVKTDDRSVIYIALDRQVLTVPGNVQVEVTFYDTLTNDRLSGFAFIVDVEAASVQEVDLVNNPEFDILAKEISAVLEAEASLTGITASATKLASTADPTTNVTGGSGAADPYNIEFGIPQGIGISNTTANYGVSASEDILPTVWVDNITDLFIPDGSVAWTKVNVNYEDGTFSTYYTKAIQGASGPAGVSVQTTEPVVSTLVWINPNDEQYITIPDLKDNTIALDSGYSSRKIEDTFLAYSKGQALTAANKTQALNNLGFVVDRTV